MKRLAIYICVAMCFLLLWTGVLDAQTVKDSVQVHFRQGYAILEPNFKDNKEALQRVIDAINERRNSSLYRLNKIQILGSASPEGTVYHNNRLSYKRANALFDYIDRYVELPDSMKVITPVGRDWRTLILMVEEDPDVPYKDETLAVLHKIALEVEAGNATFPHMGMISTLRGGEPYRYMYEKMFPVLRASRLYLCYEKESYSPDVLFVNGLSYIPATSTASAVILPEVKEVEHRFYMSARTNMLYDALLVPNVGFDVHLYRNWSLAVNWHYAWWDIRSSDLWWRTYGGDIEFRKWFGRKSQDKPLTGHHIGPYAQIVTYDFALGNSGYVSDKWNYAVGVSYGYSLPISKRLNIDFSMGVGYMWGEYNKYVPVDDCYVWQASKSRRWIGPTKAEITLVWQIGRGNINGDKW